jgi:hypothetical protein
MKKELSIHEKRNMFVNTLLKAGVSRKNIQISDDRVTAFPFVTIVRDEPLYKKGNPKLAFGDPGLAKTYYRFSKRDLNFALKFYFKEQS